LFNNLQVAHCDISGVSVTPGQDLAVDAEQHITANDLSGKVHPEFLIFVPLNPEAGLFISGTSPRNLTSVGAYAVTGPNTAVATYTGLTGIYDCK